VLDPLIAEARQRTRRRYLLLATGVTLFLASGGAAAAGVLTYQHYNRARQASLPLEVLVSSRNIPKGTPASVILRRSSYRIRTLLPTQVLPGRVHAPAKAYLERKQAEGKSRREALRCLKRQLARTVYTTLNNEPLLT
jgi:hypothetical protein